MAKGITEKLIEPSKIYVNDTFTLKIKAIRGKARNYETLKAYTYNEIQSWTYQLVKEEE